MSGRTCRLEAGYTVIIAEKPKAGEKIARALGLPVKCSYNGVPYWVLSVNGRRVVVVSSAGHLFEPHTDARGFPVFEFTWRPIWEVDPKAGYLKKFYDVLRHVVPRASEFISACDYDIEGSVICYKIIEALGDPRRARRMKFSTLAPEDIRRAYARLQPLDVDMVEAGLARHELDWLWGINVSRALMHALRLYTGRRITLSAGRVQSPTLVEATRRWEEINLHVPRPSISVHVTVKTKDGVRFKVYPSGWSPRDRLEAEEVRRRLRSLGELRVVSVSEERERASPPPAFNLGDLQHEAARIYGFSPMKTQKLAEDLYLEALISYPRTNSQKLPPTIDYRSILRSLEGVEGYSSLVRRLLEETGGVLRPVQGRAEDPAHPAIYPTGEKPRELSRDHRLVYDLIVRRFLAAFSSEAVIGRVKVALVDRDGRGFEASGLTVVKEGWMKYYPFLKPTENVIPRISEKSVEIESVTIRVTWSKPSTRITRDSLLKWMENVEIGTESTRARIIETLYRRGYIEQEGRVTDLGHTVTRIIVELFPELSTPELTREFERKLDDIRYGRRSRESVRLEAIRALERLLSNYNRRLEEVGYRLAVALNLRPPERPCRVCGREATTTLGNVRLCEYHSKALERLRDALGEISRILNIGRQEALKRIALKKGGTGRWVLEVAKKALEEPELKLLLDV